MEKRLFERLASQLSRGSVVLFTGAGFSLGCLTRTGKRVPRVRDLTKALWDVAFPDEPYDESTTLPDVFACAMNEAGNKTRDVLNDLLRIDPEAVPAYYQTWLSMPWRRVYTLNLDDLDIAVQINYQLPRPLDCVSALTDQSPVDGGGLTYVHLNGRAQDYPDVVFSRQQYAQRSVGPDPWYDNLTSEMASRPFLFVGTALDESPLWEHIELRRLRRQGPEVRPGSYLLTPVISAPRKRLLRQYNIDHIAMTAEEFAENVLSQLVEAKSEGLRVLAPQLFSSGEATAVLSVSELRAEANKEDLADYLLGRAPTWRDLTHGFAVVRTFEPEIVGALRKRGPRVVFITGTAGSGKSTTLMRLGLAMEADGLKTMILDTASGLGLARLRQAIKAAAPQLLLIDDVDVFGKAAKTLLGEIAGDNPDMLLAVAVRGTQFEGLEIDDGVASLGIPTMQVTVPHLADEDVEGLITALDRAKRLGRLRGMTHIERVRAMKESAGRQLLVAMIQATSGRRFEEKIADESDELPAELVSVYAVISLATNLRAGLTLEEITLAGGGEAADTLQAVRRLKGQHLIIERGQLVYLRHRVIAERVVSHMRLNGQLGRPLEGLVYALSLPARQPSGQRVRLFRKLINHDTLTRLAGDAAVVRRIYDQVEDLLADNFHFWLQRGSFEVESGSLELAHNFLDQARGMAPDDPFVQTAWAYKELKWAAANFGDLEAPERADLAMRELYDAIRQRGGVDHYPYHVLGSQGLSWARRAPLPREGRGQLLRELRDTVAEGLGHHPRSRELRGLRDDLQEAYLSLAVD